MKGKSRAGWEQLASGAGAVPAAAALTLLPTDAAGVFLALLQSLLLAQVTSLQEMLHNLQSLRWLGWKSLCSLHLFGSVLKSPSRCPLGGQSPQGCHCWGQVDISQAKGAMPLPGGAGDREGVSWQPRAPGSFPGRLWLSSCCKPCSNVQKCEFCWRNNLQNYADKIKSSLNLPMRLKFCL